MIKPWNEYFMEIAKTVSMRSNCVRAHVGAIIVGEDKKIKATGGYSIAQNEETCVVYGMPRAVVEAGLADEVIPLNRIAEAIVEAVRR